MSQGLALGITVGSSNTVAVTASGGQRKLAVRPSTLGAEPEVPESFLSRVGDPVDIRTHDGTAVRAADLVVAAIARAMDDAGHPATAVACYPAWWTQHTVEVQRAALTAAGLDSVALVPEPAAAMRWLQEVHESTHDGAMVVYDLGATGLTVSVARTGAMSGLLGEPVRTTTVAGAEFDLLTMRYVLAFAVGEKDFDPFDPMVEQELAALRVRCKIAKEALSKSTATTVPVRLPVLGAVDVRLVRDELEDLFRGPLLGSIDLVHEAVRRAGLTPGELDGFLLTGGGAAIPLITELLSSEFGVPVAAATDPAHLSAHGAALLAADLLADTTATEPHPALAVAPRALPRRIPGLTARDATTGDPNPPGPQPDPGAPDARYGGTDGSTSYRDSAPGRNRLRRETQELDSGAIGSGLEGAGSPQAYNDSRNATTTQAAAHPSRRGSDHTDHNGSAPRTADDTDRADEARRIPILPALPDGEDRPAGVARWKRVAIIGAAAVAVAALATGTLAMGTGVQSAPADTAAPQPSSTTVAALDTPGAPSGATGQAVAGRPAAAAPARPGVSNAGSAPTTAGAPAAEPAGQPAAGQPGQPAEAAAPGTQPNTTTQQQVPAAPGQVQPPTYQPTVVAPSLPTALPGLNDAVDGLGNAVGSVPGQNRSNNGG
ncbi:Hsp70 family protein [Nocardia inohanensis]|uniref:Hsp70 family protein n=1 Tax=Nocardia inohanensis TaxID=209246 RepID=UPI00082F4000|nr:Hsp70 family protein [Nocardia inohanensis]